MDLLLTLKYCKIAIKELVLPPCGLLLLALLGLLLLRRAPKLGRALILIGVAALWLLSTPIIADGLTAWVEHFPPLDLTQSPRAQAIVILGGGGFRHFAPEYGEADAEPYMLERIAYGAYLSHRTGLPILVTAFRDEAAAMRATLARNFGIEARWVDDQSFDTFENASNSARMLRHDDVNQIVLVTRATHLWRASHEFIAAGLQVIPAPCGVLTVRERNAFRYIPDSGALVRSHDAIYEELGDLARQALALSHLRRH
jgi:uncharacterized SAM-binding protein YcdF (DUF218 family)